MTVWKDVTSYSRGDTERVPRSFELRCGSERICVTRNNIHGDPNAWYLLWHGETREITRGTVEDAKRLALDMVIEYAESVLKAARQAQRKKRKR